jgi:UDP-N-acetylglucosamine--N-acetylmuramyl-(pentapeptide) pyrophosphoryl-undecaprenol N-acetylglucosamine transferase
LFVWKYDAVIGFGGYASFAPIIVGKLFRKKIILHEQNAVLGKVNRVLQKFANHVAISFTNTKFASAKAKYIGSFVREDFKFSTLPALDKKLNILIIGGSQGAKVFAEIFPEALKNLNAGLDIKVTHQVPEAELAATQSEYTKLGIEAEIKPFFIDIKERIAAAHLVVSRAGASSIFELVAIGRPAIFIPLKSAADNHQFENARELAANGAAWLVEENANCGVEITTILRKILAQPTILVEKAEIMHNQLQADSKQRMLVLLQEAK